MRLDPDLLTGEQRRQVVRWLQDNGCRDLVALKPIIVKGNYVEYWALCRDDPKSIERANLRELERSKRKRLRLRVPRSALTDLWVRTYDEGPEPDYWDCTCGMPNGHEEECR